MKIVIDIPEENYEQIKRFTGATDYRITIGLYEAVQNGTPIPKGHGRIVDMDKALEVIANEWGYEGIEDDMKHKVPTIIEADSEVGE